MCCGWCRFSSRHVMLNVSERGVLCGWRHSCGYGLVFVRSSLPSPPYLNQAFDQHVNLILGDVEESVTMVEVSRKIHCY